MFFLRTLRQRFSRVGSGGFLFFQIYFPVSLRENISKRYFFWYCCVCEFKSLYCSIFWYGELQVVVRFFLSSIFVDAMRKKKSCPVSSRGPLKKVTSTGCSNPKNGLEDVEEPETTIKISEQILVEVDRSNWLSDEHLDIAEIVLKDVKLPDGYKRQNLLENMHLQFRLPKVHAHCFKLGNFPVLSVDAFSLELYVLENHCSESDDRVDRVVVLAGTFDGSYENIFSLIHLVAQKFISVRPILEDDLTNLQTFRVRVEILASAFDACESLLEVQRQPWRKSMMNIMSWLRPEVTTSEVKYGINQMDIDDVDKCPETSDGSGSRISFGFDAGQFYESIKPSK